MNFNARRKSAKANLLAGASFFVLCHLTTAAAQEVGDSIINPETGEELLIVEVLESGAVITENNLLIIPNVMTGDVLADPDNEDGTITIASVTLDPVTGLAVSVTADDGRTFDLVFDLVEDLGVDLGDNGGVSAIDYPNGNFGHFALTPRGSNGRSGGGSFLGIRTRSRNGRSGGDGPLIIETVTSSDLIGSLDGTVNVVSAFRPGIVISSTGGNGGNGGGEILAGSGGRGGAAGAGGFVLATNQVDVATSGFLSYGILIQSRSGNGGRGGSGGILGGSGGTGGIGEQGGTVLFTNRGNISTLGFGSTGLLVQSLGGAAGDGGNSYGIVGIAGNALQGGSGGRVTVTNTGSIFTRGSFAHGLFAQSVGGTGGDAGNATGVIALGNSSGEGGNGGFVTVENSGTITTAGFGSAGLAAQSVGGGGGNGGGVAGLVGLGSTGGAGGNGGRVTVHNLSGADINTAGFFGIGIMAQSIGGGGGNAGNADGLVGIGRSGAGGGNSSAVFVQNDAFINTAGWGARGILAQSVAGGGGVGGSSRGLVAIGGSGGTATTSGDVTVISAGDITTAGSMASGIEVQSIGGGGGSGGSATSALVSVGGSGGSGANAGAVEISSGGNITTAGDMAHGILAQSLGGGGGNGGLAVSAGAFAGVAVGGTGSTAGNGSAATINFEDIEIVSNAGTLSATPVIRTTGDQSNGVLVESVGGGGGSGGGSVATTVGYGASASFAIGGRGGAAGNGGEVTVGGDVIILTEGEGSSGLIAQSIGGGGGSGGYAVSVALAAGETAAGSLATAVGGNGGAAGNGSAVLVDSGGLIQTSGDMADGLFVQSLGGGGGRGGYSISIAGAAAGAASASFAVGVGGQGGSGGDAAEVNATYNGNVMTGGVDSDAVTIQSVGGGGGRGGYNVSAAVSVSGAGAVGAAVGVGGSGGRGGNSGDVTSHLNGNVVTLGDESEAILVQSIAGGGGNGGFNIAGAISAGLNNLASGSVAASVGVGGAGGDGGNSGSVISIISGDTMTSGDDAGVVTIQSVAGGGGNGGFNIAGAISIAHGPIGAAAASIAVGVGGFGGDGGNSGIVDSILNGNIFSEGDRSTALLIQSSAGGGGNGGFNISGSLSMAGSPGSALGGAIGVGVGGFGGGGGDSAAVAGCFGILTVTSCAEALAGDTDEIIAAHADIESDRIQTMGDGSHGVLIQSQAGGGGNGGINLTGALNISNTGGAVGVGVGGFGGGGGDASDVLAGLIGDILTFGREAHAVIVQSLGGAGGNGGVNITGAASLTSSAGGTASIGIGGFGGGGGNAGDVTLVRQGLTSSASNSDGITVQSIGGGGGTGGVNISGSVSASNFGSSASVGLGVGGFGGGGGDAGTVSTTIIGDVYAGNNAIVAQSIGGAGGDGGVNISGGVSLTAASTASSYAVSAGVGGFGGNGGDGGGVNLAVSADQIVSTGFASDRVAIMAQSVGGSGGNGAVNIAGALSLDGSFVGGLGGFGGDGGRSDDVIVSIDTDILITGLRARGLIAQSIGGGGGRGGVNIAGGLTLGSSSIPTVSLGVGGFGGEGNSSGIVHLTQSGDMYVAGDQSIGILAQSVAGGGGDGGVNVAINGSRSDSVNLGIGVGGFAGDGADAGDVTVFSDGQLFVDGRSLIGIEVLGESDTPREDREFLESSNGILVQSIGGGGGTGGFNVAGVLSPDGSPVVVGIGGSGGAGGDAGNVILERGLNIASLLMTEGPQANAITAQSIGGGGGNAGINIGLSRSASAPSGSSQGQLSFVMGGAGGAAGEAGIVSVAHIGEIVTMGQSSDAILAQSIGGGGGNANFNIGLGANENAIGANIAIGGGTGDGAAGQGVIVDHTGNIATAGNGSSAIFAQSIGGGGGNTAASFAASLQNTGSVDIGIGRSGGSGGAGGSVSVFSSGSVVTNGRDSVAIFAQSVGNGGGVSGVNTGGISGSNGTDSAGFSSAIGIDGGNAGFGGDVTVTASGDVQTRGENSHAVQAQSIGGGGGVGGGALNIIFNETFSGRLGIGGTGGIGGFGGTVTINNEATIITAGNAAHGLFGQSVGNGGGAGGYAATVAFQPASGPTGFENYSAVANVGGDGGEGGSGGIVVVDNAGDILTAGDQSYGINAQSTGGGGGTGGLVLNGAFSGSNVTGRAGVNVGGSSDGGANGGGILILNDAEIVTLGEESFGIRAQSIGGGGGDAGLVLNLTANNSSGNSNFGSFSDSVDAFVNIGTGGGTGGEGGDIIIRNNSAGRVITQGTGAHAIVAQSVGGGGGNGGSVLSGQFSGTSTATMVNSSLGIAIGGPGGDGNASGDLSIFNDGMLATMGDAAHGIFAQSIAGGGGNGGLALAGNFTLRSGASSGLSGLTPTFAIGGAGGNGSDSGDILIENNGAIFTEGTGAHAIFAQAIGGGGGNANIGVGIGASSNPVASGVVTAISNAVSFGIGGIRGGGSGGAGGTVTVINRGDIMVMGDSAQAIRAESINGGGGDLSASFEGVTSFAGCSGTPIQPILGCPTGEQATDPLVEVNLGGGDIDSMNAENVDCRNEGNIIIGGNSSAGVDCRSTGGGGGTAMMKFAFSSLSQAAERPLDMVMRLGGTDGAANFGGDANNSLVGDLWILGHNSVGINIQSIGGGGGRAVLELIDSIGVLGTLNVSLGGINGSGESGGSLSIEHVGDMISTGDFSFGYLLQSLGGGGGSSSILFTVSEAEDVLPVVAPVEFITPRPVALGNQAEQEENPDLNITVESGRQSDLHSMVGEYEDQGREDGNVHPALIARNVQEANKNTYPDRMTRQTPPDLASSSVQFQESDNAQIADHNAHDTPDLDSAESSIDSGRQSAGSEASVALLLGAQGGTGNDGSEVEVSLEGDIAVSGNNSAGIVAQSIGAGGGVFRVHGMETLQVGLGGVAGAEGDGGDIVVDHAGDILVTGDQSQAILLQSIGGGGGAVNTDAENIDVQLSADNIGSGADIQLNQDGNVLVSGAQSFGIVLQSLGGGGGFIGNSFAGSAGGQGSAGNISLTATGDVIASGDESVAVLAQSVGSIGAGNIALEFANGTSVVGGAGGIAVDIHGGAENSLTNGAAIFTMEWIDGMAVRSGDGNETIENSGMIVGNIDLGAGVNELRNQESGTILSGSTLNLGASDNLFVSSGTISIGNIGEIQSTNLMGSFRQLESGITFSDLDFATNEIDNFIASGVVNVSGRIEFNLLNKQLIRPGTYSRTLFAGDAGLVNSGAELIIQDSIVADFDLSTNRNEIRLEYSVDFQAEGLTGNRNEVGDYLNRIQLDGSDPRLAPTIVRLVDISDFKQYSAALTVLGAEIYAEQNALMLNSVQQNMVGSGYCGNTVSSRAKIDDCIWISLDTEDISKEQSDGFPKISREGSRFSTGLVKSVSDTTSLGFSLSREEHEIEGFNRNWLADTELQQVSLLGQKKIGPNRLGVEIAAGTIEQQTRRAVSITQSQTAMSERDSSFVAGAASWSREFDSQSFWVIPSADIKVIRTEAENFRETGADNLNLVVENQEETHVFATQKLAFGIKDNSPNFRFEPHGYVGFREVLSDNSTDLAAIFDGAPSSTDPFSSESELDDFEVIFGAGAEIGQKDRWSLSTEIQVRESNIRSSWTGSISLNIPFN